MKELTTQEIKEMLVENLMLQVNADQIEDQQPLFGPNSLGLDSVDALQIVVALEKNYGLKIPDSEAARRIMQSVATITTAVQTHLTAGNANHADPTPTSTEPR